MAHIPVLVEEILQYLDPKPNENFIDCTLGDGGHAFVVLEHTLPNGRLLGIDADPEAIDHVTQNMKHVTRERMIVVNDNFRNLASIVKSEKFGLVHGILLDLGFSTSTLERGRGFSFEKDELLDMRFNPKCGIRAAEIINSWNQTQLTRLFEEYGEEKLARDIAEKIVAARQARPIVTTKQLVDVILMAYRERLRIKIEGKSGVEARVPWIGGIHPATRVFQALRIAVNDELGALEDVLPQAIEVLEPGGRFAVIAFHSLEDRIVKKFFKTVQGIEILTKKPVIPREEEIAQNFRSRSAKLRAIKKIK